jgi:hypothetical protein
MASNKRCEPSPQYGLEHKKLKRVRTGQEECMLEPTYAKQFENLQPSFDNDIVQKQNMPVVLTHDSKIQNPTVSGKKMDPSFKKP